MSLTVYLLAALFLPLFPLSMVFNRALARLRRPGMRAILLLVWPQLGVFLIAQAGAPVPTWFTLWALATALLYAYRAIALGEVGLWIGFVATSAWASLWLGGAQPGVLHLQALAFSLPLALTALLAGDLERRFGAAHTRLNLSLAAVAPRYAAVFVFAVLASVATPLFPNFFTMLYTLSAEIVEAPWTAIALALTWLLWTWSGARLVQGIVVGTGEGRTAGDVCGEVVADLSPGMAWTYAAALIALALGGIRLTGVL